MVYVRRALDRRPTTAIFSRARDPAATPGVQRSLDDAFQALNALRVVSGARPGALGQAIGLTRAQNLQRHRGLGAPEPLQKFSSPGAVLREETYTLLSYPGERWNEIGMPTTTFGICTKDGLALPNSWAVSYATVIVGRQSGILGPNPTIEIVVINPGVVIQNSFAPPLFPGVTGSPGKVLASLALPGGIVNGKEYHFPKGIFNGQKEGATRSIGPHAKVYARVAHGPVFIDEGDYWPSIEARITALVDERIGLA